VKKLLLGLLVLVVLLVLGAITAVGWQIVLGPDARKITDRTFEPTVIRQARGEYLVEAVASCFHCHSDHDSTKPGYPIKPGMKGAGWLMPIPELGRVVAPNITPDKETGIGNWTDDEIARAIQEGVNKHGQALFPIMPYMNFRNMDDEDLASIVVYLRSIPAVRNALPRSELIFPLSLLVKTMPMPLASHTPQPAPARATPEERGGYLVKNVANCAECHNGFDDKGTPIAGLEFGGGSLFHDLADPKKEIFSPNITPDPSGIQHYDEALFMQVLKTGRVGERELNPVMPFEHFARLTDADLKDIWSFIRALPPSQHRINNTDTPTKCELCGHSHGLGNLNRKSGNR
jgi:mono/diheme cytochrome c family protein